jgi:hypothetical protein
METTRPPKTKHLKRSGEFIAGLTPEKLDEWSDLNITLPEHNGDDCTPESVQRLADARDQAAEHLPAIRQRIDALRDAMDDEDWCPLIENELDHLHRALSPYHLSRYLKDALATLQEAEADLAIWRTLSQAARDERWDARERADAEAAERRKAAAQISQRQNAFYAAMFATGISPIPMADLSEVRLSESDRKMCDAELEISNMGNHLA